jgi:hypothetical protein
MSNRHNRNAIKKKMEFECNRKYWLTVPEQVKRMQRECTERHFGFDRGALQQRGANRCVVLLSITAASISPAAVLARVSQGFDGANSRILDVEAPFSDVVGREISKEVANIASWLPNWANRQFFGVLPRPLPLLHPSCSPHDPLHPHRHLLLILALATRCHK